MRDATAEGDSLPARAGAREEAGERHAVDVLHDEQELALLLHDIEGLHDVGMPDERRDPRLVHEHAHDVRIARQRAVDPLDGDGEPDPPRSAHAPQVDGAHPPGGQLLDDLVASKARALDDGLAHEYKLPHCAAP